ncbi:MAG: DNA gyrase subunit A, partial [Phototrophicales bacterium]
MTSDIQKINIEQEMRDAYLDYAMSVIVSRALPDARDGLKPVQRRILYAMYDMGLRSDTPFKKSARIVGEVLGKYHPHGDSAVYEAMVRMAQDFSVRYLLVNGQGNFGSIDGDGAAAMRYTEARLGQIGEELLLDIGKDTVNFTENFDGSLEEPSVLPASIPNLLVNGATGIAVGMSTSVPPHNLNEVCDALIYILKNWDKYEDITVHDLMRFVKGPDFPTGGIVYRHKDGGEDGEDTLISAYATGQGKVTVRAKVHIEEMGRGKQRIVISELPYQVNKTALIERIAALVRDGKLEGLADLRDESDRNGMRISVELQRGVEAGPVLVNLFKMTPLQDTFSIQILALVDNQPRLLSLKQALKVYIDHRLEIVRRRSEYD